MNSSSYLTMKLPSSIRKVRKRGTSVRVLFFVSMGILFSPTVSGWMMHRGRKQTALYSSMNAFGPFGNFLNHGRGRNQTVAFPMATSTTIVMNDDDEQPAGMYRLMTLEATQSTNPLVKLKSFLDEYVTSSIDTTIWKLDQPDATMMDVSFHDRSAVLSIILEGATTLTVYRVGSEPTTRYLIQESLLLDGILTEIQAAHPWWLANDTTIDRIRQNLSFS